MPSKYKLKTKCKKCYKKIGTNWDNDALRTKKITHIRKDHDVIVNEKDIEETDKILKEFFEW